MNAPSAALSLRMAVAFAAPYAVFTTGRFLGAAMFPDKDPPSTLGEGLASFWTLSGNVTNYVGPNGIYTTILFLLVFIISYFLFKLRALRALLALALGMGVYIGRLIDGRSSVRIEGRYERLFGIEEQSTASTIGYLIVYFLVVLGLPLACALLLSRVRRLAQNGSPRTGDAAVHQVGSGARK